MFQLLYMNSSAQVNGNLFEQLRLVLNTTINWNKYQLKKVKQVQNPCFEQLIDLIFQGPNLTRI